MRRYTLATACLVITGLLAGCTSSDNSPEPTPSVSAAPTPTASAGIDKPAQDNLVINDSALLALRAPEGVDPNGFLPMVNSAREFALVSVSSPQALSGTWTMAGLSQEFAPWTTPELAAQIAALDPAVTENSHTIMSLAAVFTPALSVTPVKSCDASAQWTDCLAEDITFTDPTAVLDASMNAVKFTFKVDSARALVKDDQPASSDISYTMNVWVDLTTHKVVSVDNAFTFSPVS